MANVRVYVRKKINGKRNYYPAPQVPDLEACYYLRYENRGKQTWKRVGHYDLVAKAKLYLERRLFAEANGYLLSAEERATEAPPRPTLAQTIESYLEMQSTRRIKGIPLSTKTVQASRNVLGHFSKFCKKKFFDDVDRNGLERFMETISLRYTSDWTAAADPYMYNVSPDYFRASGTALLAGRAFSWHDDTNAPRVAVVNPEFASKILGSIPDAIGRYFKMRDGTRVRVVGLVEDGKYKNLTEDQQPAMFLPLLQSPASWTWLVVRSSRDPQELVVAMRSVLRDIDPGMVLAIRPWSTELGGTLFPSRMATVSRGVLGMMGAMLSITGIFGIAAYSVSKRLKELGIRVALGAQRKEVLQAALGRAFKLLAIGSGVGLVLGLLATKVLAFIVYQATPRDPLVLTGTVLAMALLGLIATWIPAQRALSVDPAILLREE